MHQPRRIQYQAIFQPLFDQPFEDVYRTDKLGAIAGRRMFIDLLRLADLYELAAVHDGDTTRHGHRLFLVMGDHHAGDADALKNIHHLKLHPVAQFFIQRAHRFIKQQQFRPLRQATRQRHALTLAAGKLVRLAFGELLHMHQRQHLLDAGVNLRLR